MKIEIKYETWDDDEFVIVVNGKPVGYTVKERDAKIISNWLYSASLNDIIISVENK